jgi:hypothetical protein
MKSTMALPQVPPAGNGLARANWVALFRWMPQQVNMVRPQTPPEIGGLPTPGERAGFVVPGDEQQDSHR